MKFVRLSASLIGLSMAAALAACGGGGSGGTIPNPGGGGGPTPHPTATPTVAPTNTPTNPPSTPPIGVSSVVLNAQDGQLNGTDNWQTNGTTSSDHGDGDTATGGTGSAIDSLPCGIGNEGMVSPTVYHVHAFVGLMVNGVEFAIPDAIGMQNPTSDEPVTGFSCAYSIHTHGASGIIHVEDPQISGNWNTGVAAPAKYNLQALFDIWGQSLSALGAGGASGLPAIYVGTPSGKDSKGNDLVNSYALSVDSPADILLKHHVAIWLVYGTPPAAGLPQVSIQLSN